MELFDTPCSNHTCFRLENVIVITVSDSRPSMGADAQYMQYWKPYNFPTNMLKI